MGGKHYTEGWALSSYCHNRKYAEIWRRRLRRTLTSLNTSRGISKSLLIYILLKYLQVSAYHEYQVLQTIHFWSLLTTAIRDTLRKKLPKMRNWRVLLAQINAQLLLLSKYDAVTINYRQLESTDCFLETPRIITRWLSERYGERMRDGDMQWG